MTPIHTLLIHAPKLADHFNPLGPSMSVNYMAVGLPALAGVLETSGRPVEMLHLGVQLRAEPLFDLEAEVARLKPRMVGLSLHWHPQTWDTVQAIAAIRRGAPDAFILLGGFTASTMHEDIMQVVPEVDGIIRGDAEAPILQLAEALDEELDLHTVDNLTWRGPESITVNPQGYAADSASLQNLDYERFDLLRHHERYIREFCGPVYLPHGRPQSALMSLAQRVFGGAGRYMILPAGRGCSVSCGWCGGGRGAHRKYHGRSGYSLLSPGRTAALIARSVDLGFSGVQACFDPTPSDPSHWIAVCDKVRASNVRTEMFFESYALPHPDLVAALRRTFTRVLISMSPESPDEPVRRRFRPLHFTNDELIETVAMCAKNDVEIMLCFGRGLPGESPDSPRRARALVDQCKKRAPRARIASRSFAVEMEPGSPWAERPESYGIELTRRTFQDYVDAHAPDAQGPTAGLGYRVPNFYAGPEEDFQAQLRETACKEMCPLPPSPRLGHLTCRVLQRLTPEN